MVEICEELDRKLKKKKAHLAKVKRQRELIVSATKNIA